ncbi:hypothetical protein D043_0683B, partial [Vibrio parahaemolyticus EKP-021]
PLTAHLYASFIG